VAADGVRIPVQSGGQHWLVSWHPPPEPPDGTPHGAAGVCVTAGGGIVLVSPDGVSWDLPAGRPEPGESWEQTLRREMDEEACATVVGVRPLGFTRGQCVTGPERGLVLVRSVWRADVELRPWHARFEIAERRVVAAAAAEDLEPVPGKRVMPQHHPVIRRLADRDVIVQAQHTPGRHAEDPHRRLVRMEIVIDKHAVMLAPAAHPDSSSRRGWGSSFPACRRARSSHR
jgi:ADP-ribose pyrophosphatase YjhB (NUDIX family)